MAPWLCSNVRSCHSKMAVSQVTSPQTQKKRTYRCCFPFAQLSSHQADTGVETLCSSQQGWRRRNCSLSYALSMQQHTLEIQHRRLVLSHPSNFSDLQCCGENWKKQHRSNGKVQHRMLFSMPCATFQAVLKKPFEIKRFPQTHVFPHTPFAVSS